MSKYVLPLAGILLLTIACRADQPIPSPVADDDPVARLEQALPREVSACDEPQMIQLMHAARHIDAWAANTADLRTVRQFDEAFEKSTMLMLASRRVDDAATEILKLRTRFAQLPAGHPRREAIRHYLLMTSQVIDTSSRLRHVLRDLLDGAAFLAARDPRHRERLLDFLIQERSTIGAEVMSVLLFDPPEESGVKPADAKTKAKALRLMSVTSQANLLPAVNEVANNKNSPGDLIIQSARVLRQLGLPQDPRPEDSMADPLVMTAVKLRQIVADVDPAGLDGPLRQERQELLEWLQIRSSRGEVGDSCRVGGFEVRAGDWMLMRNPSPYNQFTDLSPGLFTHVGIVATEVGVDGIRRFVIVDLPERGDTIPANNVDQYLSRTLHYVFLRHQDTSVGRKMGEVALSVVGNETEFDLTFQTRRVLKLKGQPLKGKRINTYCAGLLVLCAQETSDELDHFFPIRELAAPGRTLENLSKLGLSIGEDFVSPTGALFSTRMDIVARREPMYDPTREIKEVIYDHFGLSMRTRTLNPSPTAYQSLREKLAETSKSNPLLAQLLAKASNVSEHMDLVSAARAGAVIETLDEIAEVNMNRFLESHYALQAGPTEWLSQQGTSERDIQRIQQYRDLHKDLYQRWAGRQMTRWVLRSSLVEFYAARGIGQLDDRFFKDKL